MYRRLTAVALMQVKQSVVLTSESSSREALNGPLMVPSRAHTSYPA